MVEILQEGLAMLVSLMLGVSMLVLLYPGVASLGNVLAEGGGTAVLGDLRNLLEIHEGYSVRLFINWKVDGSYKGDLFTVNVFGKDFSIRADFGPYQFEIFDGCILESDGVGWRNLG